MKKTNQRALFIVGLLVLMLNLLANTGFAQSANTAPKVINAQPVPVTLVAETPSQLLVYHGGTNAYDNPAVFHQETGARKLVSTQDASGTRLDGTVTVTDARGTVTTYSKPIINLAKPIGFEKDAYLAQYSAWLKHCSNYSNYVSAREQKFIANGDYEGLYKSNFIQNQKISSLQK